MASPEESAARQAWKAGSTVMIYSNSRKTWYKGEVQSIFHDDEGEWLEVRYDRSMSKQVQRYSTDIKPTDEQISKASKKAKKSASSASGSGSAASSASESVLNNFDEDEIETRSQWGKDDFLEIFSNTHQEWYLGQVVDIVKDDEGEWLNCVWHRKNGEAMSKQVQRYSTDVRPPQGKNADKVADKGGTKRGGRSWKSLQEEIKARMSKFDRLCPYFSRTLRSSTWSRPATAAYRRSKRLTDIVESVTETDSYSSGRSEGDDSDSDVSIDDGISRTLRRRHLDDSGGGSSSLGGRRLSKRDEASDHEMRTKVERWKGREVGEWISEFGEAYKKYIKRISKLSGKEMMSLTDEELIRLGWAKLHRAKFFVELNLKLDSGFRRQVDEVDVLNWKVPQMRAWLYQQSLLNLYCNKFVSHGVNGLLLFELDLEDISTIGVRETHKKRVLEHIAAFRDAKFGKEDGSADSSSMMSSSSSSASATSSDGSDEKDESNDLFSSDVDGSTASSVKEGSGGGSGIGGARKKGRHSRRESVSMSTGALSMACQTEVFCILEEMSHVLSALARQSGVDSVVPVTQQLQQRIEASKQSFCSEIENSMEVDSDEMSTLTDSIAQLGLKSALPGKVTAKDPMIEKFSGTEVAGLDIAKEWFQTLEQKKGHKRRQSVTHSDMEASIAAFADGLADEDSDDLSDIDR